MKGNLPNRTAAATVPRPEAEQLRYSALELAARIARRELTAAEVVEAHIARLGAVNGSINAVVVPLFDAARAEALAADARQGRGEPLGPLHGVPFTVKECFDVAGTPVTAGLTTRAAHVSAHDSILVSRLRAAGGILLGKTNVPQLMVLHETSNPVYGRTHNPWNVLRVAGGSTGGEAAAIAGFGTPLGLGSDLGGSIRIPAHFCGIHGFKPTSGRLTRRGSFSNFRGLESMVFQPGPLARSVADLELAMRILLGRSAEGAIEISADEWFPDVCPWPWRDFNEVDLRRLRIGVFSDDGFFRASPAVRRAVEEAAAALAACGAAIEPFTPPRMPESVELYAGLMTADGGADLRRLASGSRLDPLVKRLLRLMGLSRTVRLRLASILQPLGQKYTAAALRAGGPRSADALWQLAFARQQYERHFAAELARRKLDALVFPPYAVPAFHHGQAIDLLAAASYAFFPNVLGLPAGVVAATRVRAGEESDRPASRDWAEQAAARAEQGSAGLPVGVQVAARPWREDVALAVMRALEEHFRGQAEYPLG